jgi:hypothetical protein
MRQLSAAALAALDLAPKFFLLAEIQFSTPLRATSTPFDVTFPASGGNVYSSLTSVLGFGPPRVSTSVDREVYELMFSDHDNSLQEELRNGINGKLLTVYAGFFDDNDQPLLNSTDVFIAYKGFINSGKILNDGDRKIAVIQAASPMGSLDAISGYIVSKEGMDQVSLTDTSFDDVYSGGKSISLKWGKD